MFERLFAESGLSLDRLKSLLEVGATGSIVKAAQGDPVKQSQFSRQIKELEDFFRIKLVERDGKGIRFTQNGRELARISRFFLLGLSNFQRGCLAEEQQFRIGASATFIDRFLLPAITGTRSKPEKINYAVETVTDDEIERRLHDLTLDFGITCAPAISRPLQLKKLDECPLQLWVPRILYKSDARAAQAFREQRMPLVMPANECPQFEGFRKYPITLVCGSFLEARTALLGKSFAAFLPNYLSPTGNEFIRIRIPELTPPALVYQLAWNPRLLRLNPHAARRRDFLVKSLTERMATYQ